MTRPLDTAFTASLQEQCDTFNAAWPVGSAVRVRMDCGDRVDTITRSEAQVLSGHTAVVWLEKISGCYLLDRVTPIQTPAVPVAIAVREAL